MTEFNVYKINCEFSTQRPKKRSIKRAITLICFCFAIALFVFEFLFLFFYKPLCYKLALRPRWPYFLNTGIKIRTKCIDFYFKIIFNNTRLHL